MKIRVCSPSYKRSGGVSTYRCMPYVRVYVDGEEWDAYRDQNPGLNVIRCGDGIQGNVARVRNHILGNEFSAGADVVVMVDDDIQGIYYWEGNERHLVEPDRLLLVIERMTIMARDIGAYLWGFNLNQDKQVYREGSPFATVSPVLGPWAAHLKGTKIRYDERFRLKDDYDMSLQHLNRYRIVLRSQKYFYVCKQSEQPGGCATQRNLKREKEEFDLLQTKWGEEIVRRDENPRSHNLRRKKVREDYNPLIYVPIKGV